MARRLIRERQEFCALVRSGESILAAGRAVGVRNAIAHRWAIAAGLHTRCRFPSDSHREAITALADGRRTCREIGQQVGLSDDQVRRRLKRWGLPIAPKGQPSADPACFDALRRLATPDATHAALAREIGYCPKWIARHRKRLGLPCRAAGAGRPRSARTVAS